MATTERITSQRLAMIMVDRVCGLDLRGAGRGGWRFDQPPAMTRQGGTVYFFCSAACQLEFEQNPQKYLKAS
ncbi:MAG: YHS domain-containing protein [Gemmatimonadetes bacterium]|nr:YHS domain-containing protein [Gemmatimonadota bacterium]